MSTEYPILSFQTSADWRHWLAEHHAHVNGIWMQLYKKASGVASVTYAEALDEALCFGWIDGQKKRYDALSYLQKFTPRRSKSMWSKQNVAHIARLTAAGLMMPAGLAEVARAQADGRWDAAYDKPSQLTIPDLLQAELAKKPELAAFFDTLNKSTRYSMVWQLQTAKTEATRERRLAKLIAELEAGLLASGRDSAT